MMQENRIKNNCFRVVEIGFEIQDLEVLREKGR